MAKQDETAPRIRERVWVEKFDHSGDEPVLVGTEFSEQYRDLPGGGPHEVKAEADEDATASPDVQGRDDHEGSGAMNEKDSGRSAAAMPDAYATVAAIARIAAECGIELDRALRFMALVAGEVGPQARLRAKQPDRAQ